MNQRKAGLFVFASFLLCGCGENGTAANEPAVPVFVQQTVQTTVTTAAETVPAPKYMEPDALSRLPAETIMQPEQINQEEIGIYFTSEPISDTVFARINGISYHENPYISRDDLRYLRVLHYNPAGEIRIGELICNKQIASDLLDIFQALYDAQYPIACMTLVDNYQGDDEKSMAANNTSCFNYRVIAGTDTLSYHAQGLAIDINPQYNPYVTFGADGSEHVSPQNGLAYADREMFFPMKIDHDDLCYQLFTEHGFAWGGDWDTPKDYQHFEWNKLQ